MKTSALSNITHSLISAQGKKQWSDHHVLTAILHSKSRGISEGQHVIVVRMGLAT